MDTIMEDISTELPSSQLVLVQTDTAGLGDTIVNSSTQPLVDLDETNSDNDKGADSEGEAEDEHGTKKLMVNPPPKRRKISERKRADNAAFYLWVQQHQQKLSKRTSKLIVDDDKTLQALVRDFEDRRIITSPRDYQLELFERAKTENTIAVLDTGRTSNHLFHLDGCF